MTDTTIPDFSYDDTRVILVPTDFSERSRPALRYARQLARGNDAELHLVHVMEPVAAYPMIYAGVVDEQALESKRQSGLLGALREFAGELGEHFQLHERIGHPYVSIVELARELGAQMIVMTTHGRTGLSHFLIGSVAERVVREAPCPVVVIPSHGATISGSA